MKSRQPADQLQRLGAKSRSVNVTLTDKDYRINDKNLSDRVRSDVFV